MTKSLLQLLFCFDNSRFCISEGVREEKPAAEIRVTGLKGPSSVGMMGLADSSGLKGIKIDFQVVSTPDVMTARILSGETDAAALPVNLAANLYNRGVPFILGAVTGNGVLYLASANESVKSLKDLKGRTVYNINKGSTPDFLFRYLLSHEGLSDTDLNVDFSLSQADLVPYFASGRAETAVIPEPFSHLPDRKTQKSGWFWTFRMSGGRHRAPEIISSHCIFVRKSLFDQNRNAALSLLAAYEDSINWVKSHPDAAAGLAEKWLEMPQSLVTETIPRLGLAFVPAEQAKADVTAFLSLLYQYAPQSIGGKLPDEGFYFKQK